MTPEIFLIMRILLINPPNCGKSIPEERYGIDSIKMIFRGEPLALETLAGNLEGHQVAIVDLKADPDGLLPNNLPFFPDIIGLTGVTCEANTMMQIAKDLKSRFNAIIAVGGHHVSCNPEFFMQPCIDYIAVGLAKLSFHELVESIADGRADPIPGIYKNTNPGQNVFVPRKYSQMDLVEDLKPRYDLVADHRDKYVMSGLGGKVGFVTSAFGCTHSCAFCCIPSMTDGRYLVHGTQAVLRDIHQLQDLPIIRLVDANTFGSVKLATELANGLIATGFNKRLVADARSDTVVKHPELFALWKQAGLAVVVIGFEEISDTKLRAFNKKNTYDTNLEAIQILKRLGIRIVGDFIISPDYGYEDFEKLDMFVQQSGIDLPIPTILTPIPGTPLYQGMKDRINNHDLDYYTFTNAVMPTRMEEREFYKTYADMLKRFLSHVH